MSKNIDTNINNYSKEEILEHIREIIEKNI